MGESRLAGAGQNMWRLAFSLSVLVTVRALTLKDNGILDEKNDAVVLEGERSRQARQYSGVNDVLSNLLIPPLGTPCKSKDGTSGQCMSLKSCYPYFKIHAFSARETWVMGLYDTCSYQSPQGREVFGVCCNNTLPVEIPEEPTDTDTEVPRGLHQGDRDDALDTEDCGRVLARAASQGVLREREHT